MCPQTFFLMQMQQPTKTTTEAVERYKSKWALVGTLLAENSLVYDRENNKVHIDWDNQYLQDNIKQEAGYRAAMVDMGLIDMQQSKELKKWFTAMFRHKIEAKQRGEQLQWNAGN